MQPAGYSQQAPPKKKNNLVLIIVIVVVAFLAGIVLLSVLSSLAIFGTQRYLSDAKTAEGKANVAALARGMVACAERETVDVATGSPKPQGLPPSSLKVPLLMGQVRGKSYVSKPDDWQDPAFLCARFEMLGPQYFQYQWVLDADKNSGVVHAEADLNADGTSDVVLEQRVTCTSSAAGPTCKAEELRQVQ